MSYQYNYIGEQTTFTDAPGTTFTRTYNSIGQLTSLASSLTNSSHPSSLFSAPATGGYNALGQLVQATYGDGIVRNNTYDTMGRLTEIQDGPTGSPTYRLYLTYFGNGSVKTYHDAYQGAAHNTWNLTYDAFNRLATFADVYTGQQYSYSYDQFGNRWKQHLVAGTGYEVDYTFSSSNRNTTGGFAYAAAGNLTSDGSCTPCWVYDDSGNLTGGEGATYSYDGQGNRVERISPSGTQYDFALGLNGNAFDEYQGSTWSRTTGGVFTYANNSTYFNRTDHLGTPRVTTDYTGTIQRTESNGPFGDGFSETPSPFTDFTGLAGGVWDSESNADHFGAREYAKTEGRWLSPDPLGGHLEDPQTLNKYSYANNDPVSLTDQTGLDFYLSCQTASNTCGKDAAGNLVQGTTTTTTDANGSTTSSFNPTVVTSASLQDPNSGNTGTVNQNGVQITSKGQTAEGIFINGTPYADLAGSGKLEGFLFNINGSDEKTGNLDFGNYTYTGSRNQSDVAKLLGERGAFQYSAERIFGNPKHTGQLNFRFSSGAHPELFDYGPSLHMLLSQSPKATVPVGPGYKGDFHVDSHTGDVSHGACAWLGVGCQ